MEEMVTDRNGQGELFQQEARRHNLRVDIPRKFKEAERKVESVAEYAKFFKSFADYMGNVEPAHEREAAKENITLAIDKANALYVILTEANKDISQAIAMEGILIELEEKMGVDPAERYTNQNVLTDRDVGDEDEELVESGDPTDGDASSVETQ